MNTKRSFQRMKMVNFRSCEEHVMTRLKEVFEKFSDNIKSFELASSVIEERDVVQLLNIISKVEEISFYDVEFPDKQLSTDELNLNNLRKFSFHLCNVKIPRIVLKLQESKLKSLFIENSILKQDMLEKIFESQRNIQELEFDPYYVNTTSVNHLKLKKMKLMCNRNVLELIKDQKQLEYLDLSKAHIGDNGFLEVCKLKTLRRLKLWIDRVSWELLENLEKLENLIEISLDYDRLEVEYIRSLSQVRMPKIQKMKIKFPRLKISAGNFAELSRNFSNVVHLHVSNQSIGVLGDLLANFINLEVLVIGCDSDSTEVVNFPVSNNQHLKLKELCVYNSYLEHKELKCSATILEVVNSLLPNLEKLKLFNVINVDSAVLRNILSSHTSLTHLSINHPEVETVIDSFLLKILHEKGKKLEFFLSHDAKILIHKKIIERDFRLRFSTIKVKPWKNQILLRNSKWEHSDEC